MLGIMILCVGVPIVLVFVVNLVHNVKRWKNLPTDAVEERKACRTELIASCVVFALLVGIPSALFVFFSMAVNYM